MKSKYKFIALLGIGLAVLLAACGGSSGGGGGGSTSPAGNGGTIKGIVANNATGAPIAGVLVAVGTSTATTAADGSYAISGVPAATRAVVNFTVPATAPQAYAQGSQVTAVFDGVDSRVDAVLLPVAYTATVTNATGGSVGVPLSSAMVVLPANALTTASGVAPSGNVTVAVTPIDPSSNPSIMPGDFTATGGSLGTAGGQIESFGAMDVTMRDTSGAAVNLAPGQSATIRIPVAAAATAPPATMEAWHYNTTTGQWVSEGTLTLFGTAPNQWYEGTVTHFSNWNADQKLNTTCITGKVVNGSGAGVANARVTALGQGYVGTSTAYSAADGTFTIKIKATATALISAKTATGQSNTVSVVGGAAGTTCTAMASNLLITGTAAAGSATVTLTWAAQPSDLDSHLTGPNADGTRFHVYFGSRGSLTVAPFANLDVDNVSGFGPEVVTINTFNPGVYRYTVDRFSGATGSTILSSPARVQLSLNGATSVFTPPACATIRDWVVFELNVVSASNITVTPINTCYTATSASAVTSVKPGASKQLPVSGNW